MNHMFYVVNDFNQELYEWNMDTVEDISYMFYDAYDFKQDVDPWAANAWGGSAPVWINAFGGSCATDPSWY